MNNINKINEEIKENKEKYISILDMINEKHPNGVEYCCLKEIGKISMCKRILKSQTNNKEGIPFYKIGTFGSEADSYIDEKLFNEYKEKYSYPSKGEILISAAGTIGKTIIFDGKPAYFQDSNIVWLKNDERKILNKFLYYFYQTKPWKISKGGTIQRLYNNDLAQTKIPVPSIEIQAEIVNILDQFEKLEKKLEKELKMRIDQYEYYRNMLLSFDDSVEKKKLGEVVEIKRGIRLTRKQLIKDGKYEVYHGGKDTPLGNYSECNVNKDTVIVVNTGGIGGVKYCKQPIWCSDGSFWLKTNNKINNKYLYYYLSQFEEYFMRKKRVGGVPTIDRKCIEEIDIPIPSLEVQKSIVETLDQFDELCTSLTNGIPAEIAMRKEQYEYYRSLLLNFKNINENEKQKNKNRKIEKIGE